VRIRRGKREEEGGIRKGRRDEGRGRRGEGEVRGGRRREEGGEGSTSMNNLRCGSTKEGIHLGGCPTLGEAELKLVSKR